MKKMSRPVVTPSAPKAWHPKTSTKKVFYGGGFRAMPRMPNPGSGPNFVKYEPVPNVNPCRQSVMQNGDLLRCCDYVDASGKKKTQCHVFPGYIDREDIFG